jgi:F-type H+-transporting ATPase subunit b
VNFVILALFFWMLLRTKLPQLFRERTNTIQKALKEAQAASAEASRRLGDIEARLSKMDAEVSKIRAEAEREAAAEEQRMRAAAEEDKHKVVEAAESEIAAIARSARHELKRFAADLAVDIAAHKIHVDDNTDHALVRQFVGHLGKDGE